jgi:hypothetical protein
MPHVSKLNDLKIKSIKNKQFLIYKHNKQKPNKMKKLTCILFVICISAGAFAKGHDITRRYTASLDNKDVVKSQRDQRSSVRSFAHDRRYYSVTHWHGLHLFGKRGAGSGASKPESGLGL